MRQSQGPAHMSVSEFLPSVSRDVKAKVSRASSRTRWILIGAAIVLLAVLGWYGVKLLFPAKPRTPPPAPVRTAIAMKKDVTVVQTTIGTVVSPDTLQVTAQVQGKLLTAYFQEGQLVHKGDPLFLIDPAPFEAALTQAKGQLAKDQATLAGARSDLTRYEALMAANAIAKQTVDDERATVPRPKMRAWLSPTRAVSRTRRSIWVIPASPRRLTARPARSRSSPAM